VGEVARSGQACCELWRNHDIRMAEPNGVDPTRSAAMVAAKRGKLALSSWNSAAPVVTIGSVKFGNDLPISIIAGPCQLESRQHALEVASALKEIAARLK